MLSTYFIGDITQLIPRTIADFALIAKCLKSLAVDKVESCLSLLGNPRKTVRYRKIKVRYQDEKFVTKLKIFYDFTAQIIQHEVDHCNGVLI